MKTKPVHVPRSTSYMIVALALAACDDARLRDLGDTFELDTSSENDAVPPEGYDDTCTRAPFISADEVTRAAAADLAAAPVDDRPHLRYLSVANRLAADCLEYVESDRDAVAKAFNMVSSEPEVVPPRVLGPGGALLRVDLRDYGWTREVDIDGQSYRDGWEAVTTRSPFAIVLEGEQASFLANETGTPVPLLSADAFVDQVGTSEVYYGLLGMPDTLTGIRQAVGLPGELDPLAQNARRAAVRTSRVLRPAGNLRVIDRYSIGAGTSGSYWEALQVETSAFLADPLHVQPDVQRLILFTLPNDLLAFAITDASGARQGTAELVLDTNRDDFVATVVESCSNCHAQGPIPADDDGGAIITSRPDLFDPEVVAAYRAAPTAEEAAAQVQADSALYLDAVERSGVSRVEGDPVSRHLYRFRADVDPDTAAADLLVAPALLSARTAELPELLPLAVGLLVSRQQLGAAYARAYCVLHAGDENPPAAAFCAQAD
jgi:hypothetical protein